MWLFGRRGTTRSHVWYHLSYVWHHLFLRVTWFVHMCGMTCSCVWHDLHVCVISLNHTCGMTYSYIWNDSFICDMTHSPENFAQLACLMHTCDETHSNVWYGCMRAFCANHATHLCVEYDTFLSVTWRIHMCDMTHSCVWNEAFLYVTWPIHMFDMTHSHTWLDVFLRVEWRIQMCSMTHTWKDLAHVIFLIHICDRTHFYAYHGCMWVFCACVWYESIQCVVEFMDHLWHESFLCVTWLIHLYDMAHCWVWQNWHVWLNMTLRDVWDDFFINMAELVENSSIFGAWRIYLCDMTHSREDLVHVTWRIIGMTWLIHVIDMTHTCEHLGNVTWLTPIGRTYGLPPQIQDFVEGGIVFNLVWGPTWLCLCFPKKDSERKRSNQATCRR